MKIYTKTGDDGETGLLGGPRVRKDSVRIEAYGTVDELNAVIGVARTAAGHIDQELDATLSRIQNDLFDMGAELATPAASKARRAMSAEQISRLENAIDGFESHLEPLREFIVPGGSAAAGQLHLARTVCRRAERRVVALAGSGPHEVSHEAIVYLNRLSDLLFVLARTANRIAGVADVPWRKE